MADDDADAVFLRRAPRRGFLAPFEVPDGERIFERFERSDGFADRAAFQYLPLFLDLKMQGHGFETGGGNTWV